MGNNERQKQMINENLLTKITKNKSVTKKLIQQRLYQIK